MLAFLIIEEHHSKMKLQFLQVTNPVGSTMLGNRSFFSFCEHLKMVPNSKFSIQNFLLREGRSRHAEGYTRQAGKCKVGISSNPARLSGAWVPPDFHSYVCFLHRREGLGFLLEGGKIDMALQDPALRPHLFFFFPYFYFWEQGWATCSEGPPWSPPHLLCPHSALPTLSLGPQTKLHQGPVLTYSGSEMHVIKQELLSLLLWKRARE